MLLWAIFLTLPFGRCWAEGNHPGRQSDLVPQDRLVLRSEPPKTSVLWADVTIPNGAKDKITTINNEPVYEITEENNLLIFRTVNGWKVYPRVARYPIRIFTNNTVEIGFHELTPWDIITLKAGASTTIANTPIAVGTDAVKIGSDYLPMNLDAISSVSSVVSTSLNTRSYVSATTTASNVKATKSAAVSPTGTSPLTRAQPSASSAVRRCRPNSMGLISQTLALAGIAMRLLGGGIAIY